MGWMDHGMSRYLVKLLFLGVPLRVFAELAFESVDR